MFAAGHRSCPPSLGSAPAWQGAHCPGGFGNAEGLHLDMEVSATASWLGDGDALKTQPKPAQGFLAPLSPSAAGCQGQTHPPCVLQPLHCSLCLLLFSPLPYSPLFPSLHCPEHHSVPPAPSSHPKASSREGRVISGDAGASPLPPQDPCPAALVAAVLPAGELVPKGLNSADSCASCQP